MYAWLLTLFFICAFGENVYWAALPAFTKYILFLVLKWIKVTKVSSCSYCLICKAILWTADSIAKWRLDFFTFVEIWLNYQPFPILKLRLHLWSIWLVNISYV